MKTWKLVSGILSLVFFAFVAFQSCAAGVVDSINDANGTGGGAGVIVSILLLAGGVISIISHNKDSKGLDTALVIVFGLAALTGYTLHGVYGDLLIWSTWCLACAILAIVSMRKAK